MPVYLNEKNGPPDLEEWFKKIGRSLAPKKKNPLINPPENQEGSWWWLLILVILLAVILVFSSVVTVKPDERLVVMRFGAFEQVEGPGLQWTLPLIDQRIIVNVNQIQTVSYTGTLLTEEGDLVKVAVNLNYRIADPRQFIFYGDLSSFLQAQLIQATTFSLLTQNLTPLLSAHSWPDLDQKIQAGLPSFAAQGIQIQGVQTTQISVPDALSQSFNASVATAQTQVKQLIDNANQFSATIQPLAAAEAATSLHEANTQQFNVLIHAEQDAAALSALQTPYGVNPGVTLAYLPLLMQAQTSPSLASLPINSASDAAYLRWHASYDQAAEEAQKDAENN